MSFGGKSFKKGLIKKELEELTKKSHDEFSTLPAAEKEALRQQSKTKVFEKIKTKKKKLKVEEKLPEGDARAVSPSVDLEAELRGVDLSEPQFPFVADEGRQGITESAKIASIKSNVDLNVVMHGRKLDDNNETSGPVIVNSRASQRTSGKSPSIRSATSAKRAISPKPPVSTQTGPLPKPAIISSQNSTVQIHLSQRPTPKPVTITSRPTSKMSGRLSGKSNASRVLTEHEESENIQEKTEDKPQIHAPVHIPEAKLEMEDLAEFEDENESEKEDEGEKEEEEEEIEMTSEEDKSEETQDIPNNPSDIIHNEIQTMTRSLMGKGSSIIDMIQFRDAKASFADTAAQSKTSITENLHYPSQEENFGVVSSNVMAATWVPKTSETPGVSTKPDGSPSKTFTDSKAARSRTDTIKTTPPTREWPGLISSELQQASKTSFTDEDALQAMYLPVNVKTEDIINIKGEKTHLHGKGEEQPITDSLVSADDVTWLDSWKDKKVAQDHNIHHFCTMATTMEISPHLHQMTRDTHTPDKLHAARKKFRVQATESFYEYEEKYATLDEEQDEMDIEEHTEERRMSLIANKILTNALTGDSEEILEKLKAASDQLFFEDEEKSLKVEGVKIEMKDDSSRLYWTPAPPKMGLAPETIKSHLYPDYQGPAMLRESLGTDHVALTTLAESEDEEDEDEGMSEPDEHKARARILDRAHGSMSDLSRLNLAAVDKTTKDEQDNQEDERDESLVRFESMLDKRRQQLKEEKKGKEDEEKVEIVEEVDKDISLERRATPYRRALSEPMLSFTKEQITLISNYDISMKELEYQLDAVAAAKEQLDAENEDIEKIEEETSDHEDHLSLTQDISIIESLCSHSLSPELHSKAPDTESEDIRTETETMSITTVTSKQTALNIKKHRTSIPRGKQHKRHGKRKIVKDPERQRHIKEFLAQPANTLSRTVSFHNLMALKKDQEPKQDSQESLMMVKIKSVNDLQDFEALVDQDLPEPISDLYDWTRETYWYKWFDEVYPPSTVTPEYTRYDFLSVTTPRAPTTTSKSSGAAVINTAILDTVQVIKPEMSETDNELYQLLLQESENLTSLMEKTEKKETLAFYFCRRGAIYRKIGELKKAWDDLNRSIELESMLLDAYWHRHLLHLVQNNKKAALDDLTFIIKNNGNQARAYRSRAELYRQQGDATMAILNYSQAIKLNPNDVETYYQRASMFRMRGDMLLALEDYGAAARLLPSKTEAMFEIGKFHFNNENWSGAINDFNTILQQDPCDSLAHTYRGRVYYKMGQFDNALRDFSAAIHYDPNNAVAFYHRACILRKVEPRRALQDFSVSLLLDDSVNNVKAYLHRGILYTDLKRWEDAIPDFEAALELDPNLASAHVNIGLIYIVKYNNYHKAVRQYTSAIHVDPTYIRARICRAEAYEKMGMLQEAVMDYTRVIHVRPDVPDYHMARGKLLLAQNKLDLASYHVKQAAKLNQGLGASATQQAVVQSFLNNFDLAIKVLDRATRVNPSASLFVLLGKTNMKAKRFADAIQSYKKSIEIMTPWNVRIALPLEAAPVYFLIGLCYSELCEYQCALDAFNNAIKVNPEYAEAYYQRGLIKMKLRYARGIHDFNRALAINPKLYQAFLSRAAYYGMKNRYSKGIMSCNEAIKLQPKSVRAYLYRGALKYHIKAYGLAVKDLTEAVAIDCRCSLAYFNRAVCYHGMKFYQKALMDYSTVMLLEDKPNLKVLQNRGLLYLEVNDVENALEDFKTAAKESQVDPKIRHALGYCYHRLNRLEEAVAAFNDALRIDPFFVEAYNGRGNALMDYGHEQGNVLGRRDYLKALHINPECLSARVNVAYNLQVEGKYRDAWDQFSSAIAIDSTCQAALEGRAVVNLQMRNTFGALVDMNDAIKISKTAELLNNRGIVHQFMNDYVNAVRDYQSAIRLDPSYALAYYNAGNVYFKQRQFKQALSYYDNALSWTPNDESPVLNRAITKVLLRDPKGAIQDFNKAVELNPYAAHVYFNRGNLYASLRKYKEAEEDYTRALSLCPGDALVYKRRADVLGKQSKRDAAIEDYKKAIIIKTRSTNRQG